MFNTKKILIFTIISLLLVGSLSSFVMAKENVRIGLIPMTLSNDYFIAMVNGAKKRAKALGVDLVVQGSSSHADAGSQLKMMENMIVQNIDAICIVPSSSASLTPALRKAENAGIPVINLDTKFIPEIIEDVGLEPIPYIGTDNYDGAFRAGELALKLLDGEGKVAILEGIAGQENTRDRREGFIAGMKDKLEIVATQNADWEVEEGYNVTQNILQANPDLDLIFGSNDNMAIGAYRALQEAGKEDEVKVIGYDGVPAGLESVQRGEMEATVAQFPAEMGKRGIDVALQLINGERIAVKSDEKTLTKLITEDNVDRMIEYLEKYID